MERTVTNHACTLKPLDNLKIGELQKELQARGYDTTDKLKPELQERLCSLLKGAQRVPTILTLNPTQSLHRLNLTDYEVLDCEPLHDLKGHIYHVIKELPYLLSSPAKDQIKQVIETTLPKQQVVQTSESL